MDIDSAIYRAGMVIGGAAVVAGFVLLFIPGVADSIPLGMVVAQVASLCALLMGGYIARDRYHAVPRMTAIPEVESPLSTPTPGSDFDEMVYRLTRLRESTIEYREQIREAVGEVAVAVIQEEADCSREEAISRLKDGSWTDDAAATNFFAEGLESGESPGLLTQLRRRLTDSETAYERKLRATVAAIERRANFAEETTDPQDDVDDYRSMRANDVIDDDQGERVTATVRYRNLFITRHWQGVTAFAFVALAAGVLSSQPPLLLSSVAALGIVGYSKLGSPPALTALEVNRQLSEESPEPGDEVEVTVTVENTGESFLTDVRLVDRVPPTMRVIDGAARVGTALRPGQTTTFQYTLVAERGEYTWPVQAAGRDPSGSVEREALLDADVELQCFPRLRTALEMPVRMQTSMYSGEVNTDVGGEGIEFHSIRDYQPGDPLRRINWRHYATTGEFTTIDMREERAAKVVMMYDARDGAYVSPGVGEQHVVNRSVQASYDIFSSLIEGGHLVGLAAFDTVNLWIGPNTGDKHVEQVRQTFSGHPAISPLPPEVADKSGRYVDPMTHIRRQLPSSTQIFLFSPLTENFVYEVARQLDAGGHLITVISPDPTATRTVGQRLARLERKVRVLRLREHGIRVVDWNPANPLRLELEHAARRWGQ